jgi:hypothetical protein
LAAEGLSRGATAVFRTADPIRKGDLKNQHALECLARGWLRPNRPGPYPCFHVSAVVDIPSPACSNLAARFSHFLEKPSAQIFVLMVTKTAD